MLNTSKTKTNASTNVGAIRGKHETISEQNCRSIIAAYRQRMEWIMQLPDIETLLAEGLVVLELPQPRRGINLRSVLDSLLLENKYQLVLWALDTMPHHMEAGHAMTLCQLFELDLFKRKQLDKALSLKQWETLRDRLKLRIKEQHRRYKLAQTTLFRRYQSLLHKMVNRQVFKPEKRADAMQEASIGLIHAIDKVADNTASFGSYARTWISRHIRNYLMEEHFPVHVPINLASKILRHNETDEVDADGKPVSTLKESFQNLAKPGVSIDEMSENDLSRPQQFEDTSVEPPSETYLQKDMHRLLMDCMAQLTTKQREVLSLRYGLTEGMEHKTLADIANRVGISHQQVSMREKRALQKLHAVLTPILEE